MTRNYKTINDWSKDFSDALQTFKKLNKILLDEDEASEIFEHSLINALFKKENTKTIANNLWKSGIFVFPDDIFCEEASVHNRVFFINKNKQLQKLKAKWYPVVDETDRQARLLQLLPENKTSYQQKLPKFVHGYQQGIYNKDQIEEFIQEWWDHLPGKVDKGQETTSECWDFLGFNELMEYRLYTDEGADIEQILKTRKTMTKEHKWEDDEHFGTTEELRAEFRKRLYPE